MITDQKKTMRDALIEGLHARMRNNRNIYFVTADLGAPALDRLKADFPDRYLNVGIAEQNLVNISTGLALEGFAVYAFAIAPFISMRAYEQVRNNLSLLSQTRPLNVNLLGVGAGFSYEVSGPSHHAPEDLSIMRTLPNLEVVSPADWVSASAFVPYSLERCCPKYCRLDGKPVGRLYQAESDLDWRKGFNEWHRGDRVLLISTGIMTHTALQLLAERPEWHGRVGVLDMFMLSTPDRDALCRAIEPYAQVITVQEAFCGKGGLDALIWQILSEAGLSKPVTSLGIPEKYLFEPGKREQLHARVGLDLEHVASAVAARL